MWSMFFVALEFLRFWRFSIKGTLTISHGRVTQKELRKVKKKTPSFMHILVVYGRNQTNKHLKI